MELASLTAKALDIVISFREVIERKLEGLRFRRAKFIFIFTGCVNAFQFFFRIFATEFALIEHFFEFLECVCLFAPLALLLEPFDLLLELPVDEVMVNRVHACLVELHCLLLCATVLLLLEEIVEVEEFVLAEIAFEQDLQSTEIIKSIDSLLIGEMITVVGRDRDMGQGACPIGRLLFGLWLRRLNRCLGLIWRHGQIFSLEIRSRNRLCSLLE